MVFDFHILNNIGKVKSNFPSRFSISCDTCFLYEFSVSFSVTIACVAVNIVGNVSEELEGFAIEKGEGEGFRCNVTKGFRTFVSIVLQFVPIGYNVTCFSFFFVPTMKMSLNTIY